MNNGIKENMSTEELIRRLEELRRTQANQEEELKKALIESLALAKRIHDSHQERMNNFYQRIEKKRSEIRRLTPIHNMKQCAKSLPKHAKPMVYFIRDGYGNVKIGVTKNIESRMSALQTAHATALEFYYGFLVETYDDASKIEKILHNRFRNERLMGEWFREDLVISFLFQNKIELGDYVFEGFDMREIG